MDVGWTSTAGTILGGGETGTGRRTRPAHGRGAGTGLASDQALPTRPGPTSMATSSTPASRAASQAASRAGQGSATRRPTARRGLRPTATRCRRRSCAAKRRVRVTRHAPRAAHAEARRRVPHVTTTTATPATARVDTARATTARAATAAATAAVDRIVNRARGQGAPPRGTPSRHPMIRDHRPSAPRTRCASPPSTCPHPRLAVGQSPPSTCLLLRLAVGPHRLSR